MRIIEHIYVINLERHKDRWWFILGALKAFEFPLDRVIRIDASDGKHYESIDAVNEAAAADGFEYFLDPDYQDRKYERTPPNKYMIAANWSYARAWREIANQDHNCMLLLDDYQPVCGWTFNRFERLMVGIQYREYHENQQFRLLQLNAQPMPDLHYNYEPFDSILARGLGGVGDFGFIMSQAGAQMLLDMHPKHGITSNCLDAIIRSGQDQGCWHTIDILVDQGYSDFNSARLESE